MLNQTYLEITQIAKERILEYDEVTSLADSFTECTPKNYKEILDAICAIYLTYGECIATNQLIELASRHFGYV
jgi:hypothetical protein